MVRLLQDPLTTVCLILGTSGDLQLSLYYFDQAKTFSLEDCLKPTP
jgi:hypothetical protein